MTKKSHSTHTAITTLTATQAHNIKAIRNCMNQRTKLSQILQRSMQYGGLHQRLNDSQAMLVKLAPVWHAWCIEQRIATFPKTTSENNANSVVLSGYQNNILTLHCEHAISATRLKHQKYSLLDHLHQKGFSEIEQLNIRITPPTQLNKNLSSSTAGPKPLPNPVSENSIKALKGCLTSLKNERLAESVNRLTQTLQSIDK